MFPSYIDQAIAAPVKAITGNTPNKIRVKTHPKTNENDTPKTKLEYDISIFPIFSPDPL